MTLDFGKPLHIGGIKEEAKEIIVPDTPEPTPTPTPEPVTYKYNKDAFTFVGNTYTVDEYGVATGTFDENNYIEIALPEELSTTSSWGISFLMYTSTTYTTYPRYAVICNTQNSQIYFAYAHSTSTSYAGQLYVSPLGWLNAAAMSLTEPVLVNLCSHTANSKVIHNFVNYKDSTYNYTSSKSGTTTITDTTLRFGRYSIASGNYVPFTGTIYLSTFALYVNGQRILHG